MTENWRILAVQDPFVHFVLKVDNNFQEFSFCDSRESSIKLTFVSPLETWFFVIPNRSARDFFLISNRSPSYKKKFSLQICSFLFLNRKQDQHQWRGSVWSSLQPWALVTCSRTLLAHSSEKERNLEYFWGSSLLSEPTYRVFELGFQELGQNWFDTGNIWSCPSNKRHQTSWVGSTMRIEFLTFTI